MWEPGVIVQATKKLWKYNNESVHGRNWQFLRPARIELTRLDLNTNGNFPPTTPSIERHSSKWKHLKTSFFHHKQKDMTLPSQKLHCAVQGEQLKRTETRPLKQLQKHLSFWYLAWLIMFYGISIVIGY